MSKLLEEPVALEATSPYFTKSERFKITFFFERIYFYKSL